MPKTGALPEERGPYRVELSPGHPARGLIKAYRMEGRALFKNAA
jgi:hypothetical protein